MAFGTAAPLIQSAASAFRPPRRVSVAQGAAETLVIRQPGGYSGNWSATETPYMIQPMNALASRQHEATVFVGPARTGKTLGLLDGWIARNVTCDPGDMLVIQMSQDKAREYSKTRIDRMIRHSPKVREYMSLRGHDDNTHDKMFKHGMWLKIGWPSASQASSSDYRYTASTDYDRCPDDIDGEGSLFKLILKRTQTYGSRGMCMVESSPGRDITDALWKPATPHEAPPCSGVLGIYNSSDRHRWYWKCPDCSEYFEASPGLELFALMPDEDELMDMVRGSSLSALAQEYSRVVCPHCGTMLEQKIKPLLNDIKTARWVADGQSVTKDGEVVGDIPRSSISGYWLGGVAAAYQKWDSLILRYLQGLREYAMNGSDLTLKATINTDQGMPYLPRALRGDAAMDADKRTEDYPRFMVPDEARFLLAFVDVQGGKRSRFVVQVHAIGPQMEQWIVDRCDITESVRGEEYRIDPASYPEDWHRITERVLLSTYKMSDGSEMMVRRVGVDLGGEAGVTANAQAWFENARATGLGDRIVLMKGAGFAQTAPVQRSKLTARVSRMITPFMSVKSDYFKDQIDASKKRTSGGAAAMHFPSWLKQWFFDELSAEARGKDGKWRKIKDGRANEALDCWVGINAMAYDLGPNNPRAHFDWDSPPPWASQSSANNPLIVSADDRRGMQSGLPKRKPTSTRQSIAPPEWSSRL